MIKTIKLTILSAALGLGTLAAGPTMAHAGDLYVGFGGSHSRSGLEVFVDSKRGDGFHRHPHSRRHYHRVPRVCTPARALHKAAGMGLRHARVRSVGRHVIRVGGRTHRGYATVSFGRSPACPLLRRH